MYSESVMKTYKRIDLLMESGHGSWIVDSKGNEYLDMVAGVAVNSLGHGHPAIVSTIKNQADKLLHVSNLYWTKEQNALSEKLVSLSQHKAVFFCNSGSEAIEGALKVARKFGKTEKKSTQKIICFSNSFHGRTMGSLSVTGQKKYQEQFEPLIGDVITCEYNNLEDVHDSMNGDVCAIIVEPIQGEGGVMPASIEFLQGLKDLCETYNSLLIYDEVQCGAGRMGTFFAYESVGVVPDIICMAKGLGGGVPIGAFIVNERADVLNFGDHGSTYGGNPLVSAVAKSVIDITSESSFLEEVKIKGSYLKDKLIEMMSVSPLIKEVRGSGLLIGLELHSSAKEIISKAFEDNLLLITAGENIIRVVPPLTISYDEIDLFLSKLEMALQ